MPDHHTTAESLDALSEETRQLRADLVDTRAELREQTDLARQANQQRDIAARKQTMNTRIAIGLVFVLLACTVAAAFQVSLANSRAIEVNNNKFCPLILLLVPQPGEAPASTPRGREITRKAIIIAKDPTFGCL